MQTADVIVVGGGIAGLSAAYHLARAGAGRVVLLEREPLLATHSSARNAAIFRTLTPGAAELALAQRSAPLLDALFEGRREGWLRPVGALYVAARRAALEPMAHQAARAGVEARWLTGEALERLVPALAGGAATHALHAPGDGVMDIHAVCAALAREARAAGAQLLTGHEVAQVRTRAGRVEGALLAGGELLAAGALVLAAGAWTAALGGACGAPLPLVPLRRHLALLQPSAPLPPDTPVVWRTDAPEAYFRPESGGVLASPCDEAPWAPGLPVPDARALELLAQRLAPLAPALAGAGVRTSWACLRTFTPDRHPVIGEDPRVGGLHWLAGLGGHGMTGGLCAGQLLARRLCGRPDALARRLAPLRLLAAAPAA